MSAMAGFLVGIPYAIFCLVLIHGVRTMWINLIAPEIASRNIIPVHLNRSVAERECLTETRSNLSKSQAGGLYIGGEYNKITILKVYCKEFPTNTKNVGKLLGFVEFLDQPREGFDGKSRVKESLLFFGQPFSQK